MNTINENKTDVRMIQDSIETIQRGYSSLYDDVRNIMYSDNVMYISDTDNGNSLQGYYYDPTDCPDGFFIICY